MRFANEIALITGAAQGIGRATVELLAAEGAAVVAVDRSAEGLAELVAGLPQAAIRTVVADCLQERDVERAVAAALDWQGRIDVLVNGVGGSTIVQRPSTPVDEMSLDDFDELLRFNLVPTFLFCRHVIPAMKSRRRGKIVNVGSISARGEGLSSGAYGAAKAGIASLTRKVSREVAPWQVHCNAIAPGLTLTGRILKSIEAVPPDVQARRLAQVPLGRFATPVDQARVIAFLASSDADFVTGVTIEVTGGQ